jgi:hypothetical protein
MALTRYRVKHNDAQQCDRCGYPVDVGDDMWREGENYYCTPSCAINAAREAHDKQRNYHGDQFPDYGGADDQCGHVSSDADPGL